MASVFTYDPDPPRISSPWSGHPISPPRVGEATGDPIPREVWGGLLGPAPSMISGTTLVKLDAEPQDGPVEYKLHLLLRPRKSFLSMSTVQLRSGSIQPKHKAASLKANSASKIVGKGFPSTPPFQARQKRLEHLTTQLLWRLQQSSPYHSSSTVKLVPPALPEAGPVLGSPSNTGKLLPGLEESRGALYEIGVSDDGVFVGLTKEEMDESLTNLRAMSASLGCKVEILRTVVVGNCEWSEPSGAAEGSLVENHVRNGKLWVVEALVLPDTDSHSSQDAPVSPLNNTRKHSASLSTSGDYALQAEDSQTEQLRVSLTGATTSGKSSLLGTLSTSALDSGRGKTRLNLLKHRHEIESGITSSVAPELIGYHTCDGETGSDRLASVVNYGSGNVSSWNDIHNAAERERLVFLVDSAGHPRYRRTTVRGLVSWAPHWTLCCISADDDGETSTALAGATGATVRDTNGALPVGDTDLSRAHLELCLKLGLPLVVVITKLDVATNQGLRNTLSKVLSAVKAYGRNPVVLKPDATARSSEHLQYISLTDQREVQSILAVNEVHGLVPVVFTSAVKGSGLSKLHALLQSLPIPVHAGHNDRQDGSQKSVFHVDEIFSKVEKTELSSTPNIAASTTAFILSGLLTYNDLAIGDVCLLGPFSTEAVSDPPLVKMARTHSYPSRLSTSTPSSLSHSLPRPQSHVNITASISLTPPASSRHLIPPSLSTGASSLGEWVLVRIISIRNLRLPLRKLIADQVGTVGIQFVKPEDSDQASSKLRKGMVLVRETPHSLKELEKNNYRPQASDGFRSVFPAEDYHIMEPGAAFNIYVSSVRASAKILSVKALEPEHTHPSPTTSPESSLSNLSLGHSQEPTDLFSFDSPASLISNQSALSASLNGAGRREVQLQPNPPKHIEVVFQFIGSKEWIETGSRVLVMPKMVVEGATGLEGYVGKVKELIRV